MKLRLGNTEGGIGRRAEVERERKIVDAREGSAQVDEQVLREDVGEAEPVLLRRVGGWAGEDVASAGNLQPGGRVRAERGRGKGVHLVVVVTAEEEIVRAEAVVNATIEAVRGLRLVGADDVVVGKLTDRACIGSREQLEVSERTRVDNIVTRVFAVGNQRLGAQAGERVDGVVLVDGGHGAGVGKAADEAETFIIGEEEGSVAEDGSAERAAELVLAQLRLAAGGLEHVARIENIIAEELVRRAVELVGS